LRGHADRLPNGLLPMIMGKRVPWSLWAYAGVMLLGAIQVEVSAHAPTLAKVLLVVIMLAWLYFLLGGVRWVWIVSVGIGLLGLAPEVISGSLDLLGVGVSLIGITLLLLPVSRRYFANQTDA